MHRRAPILQIVDSSDNWIIRDQVVGASCRLLEGTDVAEASWRDFCGAYWSCRHNGHLLPAFTPQAYHRVASKEIRMMDMTDLFNWNIKPVIHSIGSFIWRYT